MAGFGTMKHKCPALKYKCPVCGCSNRWAQISFADDERGFEESYHICKLSADQYEDGLLIVNHENDENNYFSIEILRENDESDICLECETIFS